MLPIRILVLPANIGQGWKGLAMTNDLAFQPARRKTVFQHFHQVENLEGALFCSEDNVAVSRYEEAAEAVATRNGSNAGLGDER